MVATIFMLGVAAWSIPDDLKPTEEEVNALAQPATRILLRHVDLSGKLTGDALDAVGMLVVISGYYVRTAAMWRQYRAIRKEATEAEVVTAPGTDLVSNLFHRPEAPHGDPDTSTS